MAAQELFTTTLFNDANLVDYYKLENVNDSKGAKNWTNNNAVAFNPAKFNNGADFGAANTNKSLSQADALSYANGAYSISLWVKISAEPGSGVIYQFANNYSTTTQYLLSYINNAGTRAIQFQRFNGVSSQGPIYNVNLGTAVFHNVVMSYDGSNISGYLDGALVAGPTAATGASGSNSASSSLGSNANSTTAGNLSGILDDVAYFTRALTQTDVNLIYNGPAVSSSAPFLFNFI